MLETGSDDPITLSVEDSSGAVPFMKDNGIPYGDRLLAGRGLYQVFVRDPNGVVVELNDYTPDLDAIDPICVQGRDQPMRRSPAPEKLVLGARQSHIFA